ncbi:MAG: hypothetical protein LIP11_19780 [Clostridiales bacterium]|nr:hypothetical protein [Clostridiales bacterium]
MRIMRSVLRFMVKVVLFPVAGAAVILKWAGMFVVSCSAWIFRILAMVFFLTAVLSGLMGLEEWPAVGRMLAGAFVIFLVPCVGETIVAVMELVSSTLVTFILS